MKTLMEIYKSKYQQLETEELPSMNQYKYLVEMDLNKSYEASLAAIGPKSKEKMSQYVSLAGTVPNSVESGWRHEVT